MAEPDILTADETAAYLRLNLATVYRLAAAGEIPAVKIGRSWRFSRRLLDEWLDRQMWANLAGRTGEEQERVAGWAGYVFHVPTPSHVFPASVGVSCI